MKKYIFFLALNSVFQVATAQCVNNVSTNAPYSTNNYLPIDSVNFPSNDNVADIRFLNGLEWWHAQQYDLTNMGFSSSDLYTDPMDWIQTVSQESYYNYLKYEVTQRFLSPQNGWELLHINLGRYPNNIDTMPGNSPYMSIPYIILYNRYMGVARVFVRYGHQSFIPNVIDGVKIDLFYEAPDNPSQLNLSGIFRLASGIDQPLDIPTKVRRMSSVAPSNAQVAFWRSADFQLAYDPCVCFYPSYIDARFSFFNSTNLKLHGRSITTDENLVQGLDVVNNDFLGSFDQTTAVKDGFIIYKQMESMIDDYIVRLEKYQIQLDSVQKHNKKVERNLIILKGAKALVSMGSSFFVGSPELLAVVSLIPAAQKWYEGSNDSTGVKKGKKEFGKALDKALWETADILFKENLTKKPEPSKPTQPTASFTEMYFHGSIYDTLDVKSSSIRTPGSKNSNMLLNNGNLKQSYPVYNEALGVFALLKSPKFNRSQSLQTSLSNYYLYDVTNNPNHANTNVRSWLSIYQFKIAEDLAYYLNPVLDIDSYDMYAAIKIDVKRNNPIHHFPYVQEDSLPAPTFAFVDPIHTVNLTSNSIPIGEHHPLFNDHPLVPFHNYFLSGIHQDSTPQNISITNLEFNSPFIPINAFKSTTFQLGIQNQLSYFVNDNPNVDVETWSHTFEFDAYLKVALNIRYNTLNQDGVPNEFDYLFTYKIDDGNLILVSTNVITGGVYQGSNNDVMYPENLVFDDVHFDGTNVEGCIFQSNSGYNPIYTCTAMNEIIINGNVSMENGYQVVFRAGNTITVNPESEISPETVLMIDPIYDYSQPMPMQSFTQVQHFCDSGQYAANSLRSDIQAYYDSIAQANPTPQPEPAPIEFIVFPNPTTGASQAGLVLPELSTVSISIIDITGKVQGRPVRNQVLPVGRNLLNLESEPLAPGVYFVQVVVNGEKLTQRLVKQ